jgi:hypothetical protein
MKKNIEVTCECQPKKLSVFDEVFLKDGSKGTVVEFDKSRSRMCQGVLRHRKLAFRRGRLDYLGNHGG